MAEEKKEGMDAGTEALLFVCGFLALVALWWYTGGPERADLRGMFLQPPPPLGGGEAYGPDFVATSSGTYEFHAEENYQYPYQQ